MEEARVLANGVSDNMFDRIIVDAIGVLFVGSWIAGWQFLQRYCFNYCLTDDGMEFRLFGSLEIGCVPWTDIVDVRIAKKEEMEQYIEDIYRDGLQQRPNRLWGQRVLLKRRSGRAKMIAITPDNPESFVAEVKKRIQVQ